MVPAGITVSPAAIGPWFTRYISSDPVIQFLVTILFVIGVVVVILAITLIVSRALSGALKHRLEATGFHLNIAILLSRAAWIGIWSIGVLVILYFLGVGLAPLAAVIGVVGLAAGLSLQQVLQNLVAGVYLLAERPFRIGDIVAVVGPAGLNHVGRVQDIEIRTTHLRSLDDEDILVPNSAIFSGIITNRTVVGGSAVHVTITFPRSSELQTSRDRALSQLRDVQGVLSNPQPEFRATCVSKDTWTANVTFWASTLDIATNVLWAIGAAFPDATAEITPG